MVGFSPSESDKSQAIHILIVDFKDSALQTPTYLYPLSEHHISNSLPGPGIQKYILMRMKEMADRKGRLGKVSLDQVQASRRGQRALKERENGRGWTKNV